MPVRKLPPNAELIAMYRSGMSCPEIGELTGCAGVTVQQALQRAGEILRTPLEAAANREARGRTKVTRYWLGKHQPAEMVERRASKIRGERHYTQRDGWQHSEKPVTEQWLRQQYVGAGLSTYDIAKMIGCDPKTVWAWLQEFSIPTRGRGWKNRPTGRQHQNEAWLRQQYVEKQRSCAEIGAAGGVTEGTINFWLVKFGIARRSLREARRVKPWGLSGAVNGMYGRRGADTPSWRGGVTPERQAVYSSEEWAAAVVAVRMRDGGTCRRCGAKPSGRAQRQRFFHIHHLVSFAVRELRCEPDNLVQLCRACHLFVHSRKNTGGEFIVKAGEVK